MFLPFKRFKALAQVIVILSGAFLFIQSAKASDYEFNDRCQKAFREVMFLQFSEARVTLAGEKLDHPDNLMADHVGTYIDFIILFSGENRATYNVLKKNRGALLERLEHGDHDTPYYRFLLADATLKWAFIKLKFKDYAGAGLDFRRVRDLLEENQRRFPDFLPNALGLGMLHTLAGMIPQNYQWLAQLAGFEGSVEQGSEELQRILKSESGEPFIESLRVIAGLSSALIHVNLRNDKTAALTTLAAFDSDPYLVSLSGSPVVAYAKSTIYLKTGRNDDALHVLGQCMDRHDLAPLFFLSYLHGLALLNTLDIGAKEAFQGYIDRFRGSNYIKSSLQKMAWSSLIHDDSLAYARYMQMIPVSGAANVDEDKSAQLEAESGTKPLVPLLKARLLSDGGYYRRALDVLLNERLQNYLRSGRDLAEYHYRLGRIYHETGNIDGALRNYTLAIKHGKDLPQYFAGSAALHLGYFYEKLGERANAEVNYRLCLTMDFTEYKTSLDQKAKAGLTRIRRQTN